jgi:hypothetical protein
VLPAAFRFSGVTRGIYAVRADHYLDLDTRLPQLADERGNAVYFSLRGDVAARVPGSPPSGQRSPDLIGMGHEITVRNVCNIAFNNE